MTDEQERHGRRLLLLRASGDLDKKEDFWQIVFFISAAVFIVALGASLVEWIT